MPFLKLARISLAISVMLMPVHVIAQDSVFQDDWYVTLNGTQGGAPLSLSLIEAGDAVITGRSCGTDQTGAVSYRGKLSGLNLNLTVYSQGDLIGTYTLSPDIIHRSAESRARFPDFNDSHIVGYSGQYQDYKTGDLEKVNLNYSAGSYGTPEKRYVDFPGTDGFLEDFARKVISAFLTSDKEWLSQNVNYPALMYVGKEKALEVNSPVEFIENYQLIATDSLLAKMPSWPTCNFWTNHSGLRLGRGEIWLWPGEGSTDEDPVYGIKDVVSY